MTFRDYINDLVRHGKYSFSIEQAQKALGKSRKAIFSSIEHFLVKGELASPARGFYVIVSPEYQVLGCLPAEQFIPALMDYWNRRYYAGLLTAARYHGAAHQAVQVFQVMMEGRSKPAMNCGKVKIQFIANQHLSETPIQTIATPKSMLKVSTPEGTAMDLFNYPHQAGGLNHIVTVLAELQAAMNPEKLLLLIKNQPTLAWKQRLGYLLEKIEAKELVQVLKNYLSQQARVDYIPLMSGIEEPKNATRNATWKIIENATVESDI